MNLIKTIPTYTNDTLRVYEDTGEVVVQVVGDRGSVKTSVRLSDWGADQLIKSVTRALGAGE